MHGCCLAGGLGDHQQDRLCRDHLPQHGRLGGRLEKCCLPRVQLRSKVRTRAGAVPVGVGFAGLTVSSPAFEGPALSATRPSPQGGLVVSGRTEARVFSSTIPIYLLVPRQLQGTRKGALSLDPFYPHTCSLLLARAGLFTDWFGETLRTTRTESGWEQMSARHPAGSPTWKLLPCLTFGKQAVSGTLENEHGLGCTQQLTLCFCPMGRC